MTTGAGMVEVKDPRVDDRRQGQHYRSVILPADMRKSPKVTEVLPVPYLRGLSKVTSPPPGVSSSAQGRACRLFTFGSRKPPWKHRSYWGLGAGDEKCRRRRRKLGPAGDDGMASVQAASAGSMVTR